jgi:hypothetical protein
MVGLKTLFQPSDTARVDAHVRHQDHFVEGLLHVKVIGGTKDAQV